ncbi:hypothetical protein LWI28_016217 [Acer negundo]|uniref:DNA-directed RNA polymerase I subunit rpa49 n=1 Tax=Acer negundo TaxID=4023 RepID=A0AAD5NJP7_ACENE|nr:hypothetical protein LWI28_016217 [Acer negundo]
MKEDKGFDSDAEPVTTTTKKKSKKRNRDKEEIEKIKTELHEETEKTETTTERIKATIQFVPDQPNKTPPLVGYFPSGFDPNKTQNRENGENPDGESSSAAARVRVYRNMNERRNKTGKLELVVSPAGSGVDFVGTSYSGEAIAPQLCQYAVGVLDKKGQTLKIVPIASNKIFRLEPRVGGSDVADKEATANVELTSEQAVNVRAMLDTRYGTKKSLRQSKKMNALKKENDPESQKDLEEKIQSVKINKEALESTSAEAILNVPPYDSSATTPELAYPLDKIVLKGEWDFLQDIYQQLDAGAELAPNAYPSFVCNRIHKVYDSKDEVERKTLSCIFSYITHLVKFKDQNSMDGAASAKNHRIPSILRQKFSTKFSNPESRRLSDDKIHLLISYVLVLTLHADGFRTCPTDIAKDLRMSEVKLRDHFEKLGCKLKREKNMLFASLPVPLQFPKPRQRRRR